MKHQFIHACAGSGKTQYVIDRCVHDSPSTWKLIITLTTTGQDELKRRLQKVTKHLAFTPEVTGWYAFLINHILRPYLPLVFPKQRISGFTFNPGDARKRLRYRKKSDPQRYFNENGMVYRDNLEELAAQIMKQAAGLVENRLGRIYNEIIIDEAQDISRSGLDIIERLMHQNRLRCMLVGDSRQSLLDSSLSSSKNKQADRQNLMGWYRKLEDLGCLTIDEKTETSRFNQIIADFSDSIFPSTLGFAATESHMTKRSSHDGVFLLAKEDLIHYIQRFKPTVLRASKSSWKDHEELNPINFGISKGRTYPRVTILATSPIQKFCLKGEQLADKSACAFYVAVTRARYSVAIAFNQNRENLKKSAPAHIPVWTPQ